MKRNLNNEEKAKYLPLLAIFSFFAFLVIDSSVDSFLFYEKRTFLETLFSQEPIEIWMRSLVLVMILSFAFYTRNLLIRQHKTTTELKKYKEDLERRGKKLQISNDILSKEIVDRKKDKKN